MLTPEHIKPFILHPNLAVSHAAIKYFSESNLYLNDPSLMPLVLQKLKQVKEGETFYLHQAIQFQQSEETVAEIVELFCSKHTDINIRFQLSQMIIHCDLSLLEPYTGLLSRNKEIYSAIQERNHIAKMDNGQLFETFEQFLKAAHGKYINEINTFLGEKLVHELTIRKCVEPGYVLHLLDSYDPDNDFGYETVYYTLLAGEMQLEAAVPILCGFLGAEDDLLPEYAGRALVQIGTESVIKAAAERYTRAPEEFYGLYASGLFGKIKLPASEEALLALLPEEKNITNATRLADGLCELGSIKGIPAVQALVEGRYDSGHLNLKESLYAHCVIANINLPQMNQWKLELEEEERWRTERQKELDWMYSKKTPAVTSKRISGATNSTYVNTNKVGRNDPCPCGSGKKYKKCCG